MVFYVMLSCNCGYKTARNISVTDCIEILKKTITSSEVELYQMLLNIFDELSPEIVENFKKSCKKGSSDCKVVENFSAEYKIWIKCKDSEGVYNTLFVLKYDNKELSPQEWIGFTKYQELLSGIIRNGGLKNPSSSSWDPLYQYITKDVLDDAHEASSHVYNYYKPLVLLPRKCKQMSRIEKKHNETKRDREFKIHSDFIAFYVKVSEITNIAAVVEYIANKTLKEGGVYHIRNSITNDNGIIVDIVQFIYAYIPSIGYVMEFQVGHPLARYVFSVDSAIREGEQLVDLWTNNFYKKLVTYITLGVDFNYLDEVEKLYDGKTIPTELTNILKKLSL